MNNFLIKGHTTKFRDIIIPEAINFIDLLTYSSPIILKIWTKTGPIYLKYGSNIISNDKVRGRYSICENIKKLYSLSPDSDRFKIIHSATKEHFGFLDKKIIERGNPWGINFRYVSMCKLGKCFSTDPYDFQCPKQVQEECKLCDGKKLWNKYRKIFPKFYAKLSVKNLPEERIPLITSLETRTYEEMREDIEFIYDTVYAYLPIRFGDYMLREIEIEPLGYTAKTSYISLKFNPVFIEILIDNLLNSNKELLELLKFKFYMYVQYKLKASSLDASLIV